jgi:hypothetical protein
MQKKTPDYDDGSMALRLAVMYVKRTTKTKKGW